LVVARPFAHMHSLLPQQTGVISYFYTTPEGWVQPEVE
jgi:hypothetical protein